MNRRTVLASVGTAILAGCLTESSPGGTDSPSSQRSSTPKSTQTEVPTSKPSDPNLRIPGENHCPKFDDDVKRVVCYQNAGSDTTLLMEPSTEQWNLPKANLSFTLRNETGATFTTNYYNWNVWKQVDSEWVHIAPRVVPEPAMMLESGGTHAWNLTVDNTDLGRAIDRTEGTENVTLDGLGGGGTYAFGISGWFEGENYDESTGVATRFELVGDPLELVPTNDLRVVGTNGGEKHVRTNQSKQTYVATRVESAADATRMIPEQVIRLTPLRNMLASFEDGIDRVRLDGRDFPLGNSPNFVEYGGETYRIQLTAE